MTKIGSKTIVLDAKDFVRGMTSSAYADDGFFSSNAAYGVNIATIPGVVYSQHLGSDITPSTPGAFMAGCKGGGANAGLGYQNNYYLTDTGKFYNYNGTSLSLGATEAVKAYSEKSDIIFYKEALYATSSTDITLLTTSSYVITAVSSNVWWTSVKAKAALSTVVPHKMLVYEDSLWISDGQYLHKWDNTTATAQFLTLTDDQNITALGVEPGSGRMMIASTQGANFSGTIPRINKISLWDGFSNKVLRSVIVDDMVTAIYSVGGTTFILYGRKLGYWNGSGITFLRQLDKITSYSGSRLPYNAHVCAIGNCLYVVDGTVVLAYESVMGGAPKVFYYAWGQYTGVIGTVGTLKLISDMGEDNLGVAFTDGSTNYFFKIPTRTVVDGATDSIVSWRTKWFKFVNRVRVRRIKVSFATAITNNKSPLGLSVMAGDQNVQMTFTNTFSNAAGNSQYELDYEPRGESAVECDDFYLYVYDGDSSYSFGIRKFIIYYDDVE